MSFNGWAALLNGLLLSGSCDVTQEDFNELCPSDIPVDETDGPLATLIDGLDGPPEGLGVPPLRVEDLTYVQRDGVTHFNDWYEPRIVTLKATVCPDDCPNCGGVGSTSLTARQKVALITEAWSRQCCDVELVLFTDCHGTLDPDSQHPAEEGVLVRTNYALNPAAVVDGSDAEWIERYPLKGTYSYETDPDPISDTEVLTWAKKTFMDTQTADDDGFDHYQSVDAAPPIGLVESLDWAETWPDLTNWTGSGWAVAAGDVESTEPLAVIYRDTSDLIGKVEAPGTYGATIQLRDTDDTVLGSVTFPPDATFTTETLVTVVGAAADTDTANGDGLGTVELDVDPVTETLTVSGSSPAPWTVTVDFVGSPSRVVLVAPEAATPNGDFEVEPGSGATIGSAVAVGTTGNVYVLDNTAKTVWKFDPDGAAITDWVVSVAPTVFTYVIAVDSAENVYVGLTGGGHAAVIYKYNSTGTFIDDYPVSTAAAIPTVTGLDVDSAGNMYLQESSATGSGGSGEVFGSTTHKLNAAGTQLLSWSVSALETGLSIDASDNIYASRNAEEPGGAGFIQKRNTSGTITDSWFVGSDIASDVTTDSSGFVYVAEENTINQYSSTGTELWTIPTTTQIQSLDVSASGEYLYGVAYDNTVYRWIQQPGLNDSIDAYVFSSQEVAQLLDPSTVYTVSFYGYAESATSALARVVTRLQDGAGNWLAAETAGTTVETNGAWARASVTFTTPVAPGSGTIYLAARSEWVKTDWQIGDLLGGTALHVEKAAAPSTYFDGHTLAVSGDEGQLQYTFTGLDDASTSEERFHVWEYDTNRTINGPYGVVGRPRGASVIWNGPHKCAEIQLRFDGKDQNMYVLDDCGTPGYQDCVDISIGTAEYVWCLTGCDDDNPVETFPICFNTFREGFGPEPVQFTVTGTQTIYPEITIWTDTYGNLANPITVENVTDGTFITYGGPVVGEPVVINTQDGTAFQGDTNVTYLLGGNVTTFSLSPGAYEFRVLANADQYPESSVVTVCWRSAVISG